MAISRQPISLLRATNQHRRCRNGVLTGLVLLWCFCLSTLGIGYLSGNLRHHRGRGDIGGVSYRLDDLMSVEKGGDGRHGRYNDRRGAVDEGDGLNNLNTRNKLKGSDGLTGATGLHGLSAWLQNTHHVSRTSGDDGSGDGDCDCLAHPQLETVQSLTAIWLPGRASAACRERCASIKTRCEDCAAVVAGSSREDRADCGLMCAVHGSCPKKVAVTAEQLTRCPPYDASQRDDRLALLASLGGRVTPGTEHPGIEVRGIDLRSPEILSSREFWCALRYLIYDVLVVLFKDQTDALCEADYTLCTFLADADVATRHRPDSINHKVVLISNHPLLGVNAIRSTNWHFDGRDELCPIGVFAVQSSAGPYGRSGFADAAAFVRGMSLEMRSRWNRIRWRPLDWAHESASYPILFHHPVTNKETVLLITSTLIDAGGPQERILSPEEKAQMIDEVSNSGHSFNVTWATGDVGFVDNLGLLHRSLPDSFRQVDDVGLRVARKALCGCRLTTIPNHV